LFLPLSFDFTFLHVSISSSFFFHLVIAVRSVYALSVDLSRIDMIEYTPNDTEAAYLAGLITGAECLLSGATTVLDHFAWVPDQELESLEAVVRAYREVGIRAVVAPLVSDQPIENTVAGLPAQPPGSDLSRPVQHIVNCMREAVKRFHRPEESILIGVGPTGVQKCTDQLFRELISLSREYSLPRHSHVLETKQQDIQARESAADDLPCSTFMNSAGSIREQLLHTPSI
jgi:cytosine/adenosine deaminase-related metal-dependent hydrolase